MMALADPARRGQLLVAAAAVAWSTAGPVQRAVDASAPTQAAVRAGVAVVALTVYLGIRRRGGTFAAFRSVGRAGIGVAIALAFASCSFILALADTSVAHVLLFQAIAPFLAALFAWLLMREAVPGRTWFAMAAALAGVAIMVGGSLGSGGLQGDLLSLVMALAFAVVIVITRRHREISMTPATALGMAISLLAMAPFAHPGVLSARDFLLLAALGAGQMALGMILFTAGARLIPAAQAGLITLLEVVLGPLWVWMIFREQPDALTLAGGAVIIGAVLLHALANLRPTALTARSETL
ncbi:MAG TPA: DMT family transporter [Gaiellales bacterium]|jgi:drug/metabolite transporter (DMT)-like permease|nr:DMT family transporter [Gaiellales bacterium]